MPTPDVSRPPDSRAPDTALPRDAAPDLPPDAPAPAPDGPAAQPDLQAPGPPAQGLVGHWRLDETSGLRAGDSSGNANHGDLKEYPAGSWQAGRKMNALSFDGLNNWVNVPSSPSLDGLTTSFTLAAWVLRSTNKMGWSSIVSKQAGTTGAEHYALAFNNGAPPIIVASHQAGVHVCRGPAVAATGQWLHMAGTWDGATARLYVDGAEICMFARSVTLAADVTPLIIGGNANSALVDAQELFAGLIDEVVVYNRALSSTDVAALAR